MHHSWLSLALLALVGLVAGFINTVAGAGSLLSLPALMLLGIPADAANATNRVAVFAQSVSGGVGFYRARPDLRGWVGIVLPTLIGGGLGALCAARLEERPMRIVLLVIMLVMAAVMVLRPKVMDPPEGVTPLSLRSRPVAVLALLASGFYGGFLQAGVGLMLLFSITGLLRYDLIRGNALKLIAVALFTGVALVVFSLHGKVRWVEGGVLAVGSVVGAQIAVRFALTKGTAAIRGLVIVTTIASAVAILIKYGI